MLNMRLFGERVSTSEYQWYPYWVMRKGILNGVEISSSTVLIPNKTALVIKMEYKNKNRDSVKMPVQIITSGGMDYVHLWDFPRPIGTKKMDIAIESGKIVKINNNKCMAIGTDFENLVWFNPAGYWDTEIILSGNSTTVKYLAVVLGERENTLNDFEQIMNDPQKAIDSAHNEFEHRVADLFEKLPVFEAADERLEAFYYRSLVHYLTNKWQVLEFVLNPFYSTGSIKGGSLLSYLWDFSEGWEIHSVFDPCAIKEHIKQYLKIDITNCFAFNPMSGEAVGPWYPINQEKILGLIYYYVIYTEDVGFLHETVNGKTIMDWVVYHAMLADDKKDPARLYDYGIDGEHHLELRQGYPYHGVLPDLNGRRYQNYIWAYELSQIAGKPMQVLSERTETLKKNMKEELWNQKEKWFDFIADGQRQARYTIQMFKLIGSSVLDEEELEGLLSHLNEDEFLSAYGLHSMSKKDPAYDQIDIDNGGGGSCTVFPPQIAERLYKAGYPNHAEDIIKRILWWGERMPYWGDSFVANNIDYRKDTPLQCTIGGVVGAQCIIFGMFGVKTRFNGDIEINPHPPVFSTEIKLKGLRVRECCMDIAVSGKTFTVTVGDDVIQSTVGVPIIIKK